MVFRNNDLIIFIKRFWKSWLKGLVHGHLPLLETNRENRNLLQYFTSFNWLKMFMRIRIFGNTVVFCIQNLFERPFLHTLELVTTTQLSEWWSVPGPAVFRLQYLILEYKAGTLVMLISLIVVDSSSSDQTALSYAIWEIWYFPVRDCKNKPFGDPYSIRYFLC